MVGAENRCMVMCCSKKVFIGLCTIYRRSAYKLATKSRERKEKLVLFRASKTEVEPKEDEIIEPEVVPQKIEAPDEPLIRHATLEPKVIAQNADPSVRAATRNDLKKL
jgi:hypothetical protein